jgi:hypothetical protein
MANKPQPTDLDRPYRLEDHAYGPPGLGDSEAKSWTDGLPHDFKGWGPQTPDPDAPAEASEPDGALTWDGEDEGSSHHVWRFDGRGRRRHH